MAALRGLLGRLLGCAGGGEQDARVGVQTIDNR